MDPRFAYRLVRLANGCHSVHSLAEKETFHPVIGPAAEAEALYVRQLRLRQRMDEPGDGEFVVWDVGLGAAANALTMLRATRGSQRAVRLVSFDHTLEALRFALEHTEPLAYLNGYEDAGRRLIEGHASRFEDGTREIRWEFHLADFPMFIRSAAAPSLPAPHAIMFDAYSPARNPAMWTLPLFAAVHSCLRSDRPCAMPTYSRSTMLRVSWLLAGFYVGVGHATGEKEETTIAANSPALIEEPLDARWLRRVRRSTSAEPLREPAYRQAPLAEGTWEQLRSHPQFAGAPW